MLSNQDKNVFGYLIAVVILIATAFLPLTLHKPTTAPPILPPTPTPDPNVAAHTIKVLSIAHYPLRNGRLDTTNVIQDKYGEYALSLEQVRQRVKTIETDTIKTLTENTRHLGQSQNQPQLTYEVIEHKEYQEAIPLVSETYNGLPLPDYNKIMNRENICHYVDDLGVDQVWLWSYGGVGKAGWESNMASRYGDVSNSSRDTNDLPICTKPYVVFDYNYGRGVPEAVLDHLHYYEAVFNSIDPIIFQYQFIGENQRGCGTSHLPPNALRDYQYDYKNAAPSYCDSPTGPLDPNKPIKIINCDDWGCTSLGYYKWWMQHVPEGWWEYIAKPDSIFSDDATLE